MPSTSNHANKKNKAKDASKLYQRSVDPTYFRLNYDITIAAKNHTNNVHKNAPTTIMNKMGQILMSFRKEPQNIVYARARDASKLHSVTPFNHVHQPL